MPKCQDIVEKSSKNLLTKQNLSATIYLGNNVTFKKGGIATSSYRRRRRRKASKGTLFLTLFLTAVLLVSCTAGSNAGWFRRVIGADLSGYRTESVIAQLPTDGDVASALRDSIDFLTSNSIYMKPFESASGAAALYRDEILNSLLREHYATYVGNPTLSTVVNANYPHLTASVLIPETDFQAAVNRYLGLSSASHRNGELFTYLSRAACYMTPLQVKGDTVLISVVSLEETENTYRFGFTLSDAAGLSASYSALFVKRNGGNAYLRALSGV